MNRLVVAIVAAALMTPVLFSGPALADGAGGGGPPLGPADDPVADANDALKVDVLAGGCDEGVSPFCTLPEVLIAAPPEPNGDQIGPDYAEIVMVNPPWKEPQYSYAINWCGPGTTATVVTRWAVYIQGRSDPVANYPGGKDAYQGRLANDLGEMSWSCYNANGQLIQCTTWGDMVRVTNSEAALGGFYVKSSQLDFSGFKLRLKYDIHDARVPVIPAVYSSGLPGWNRSVAHWVSVKQYWVGGDTITYGDPAGPVQSGSTSTNAWHVVSLSGFYYNNVRTFANRIVW